ncbi:MAG: type I pantothenate kinase [Candidatus Baumannia cicadellinicola]|nr:type I pantothenate kinase [Candidatus Baumannia cicadellinicola]MCJ7462215.1 type I pantothenate kinase [Candidatus Baumannia cicadellinicola]MCJ7462733.1 type I pantothenate kinase [Candidatus Baumannia cicadellinicola]
MKAVQQLLNLTTYLQFSCKKWAALSKSFPLTKEEVIKLKSINKQLSLKEVSDIYLPLSHLLNFYINSNRSYSVVPKLFLGTENLRTPFIIGITGSVAAGKSTTARVLQILLSRWPENRTVDLVTTDDFLHPNQVLKERDLMKKKGFPNTYDIRSLMKFILEIKSGMHYVTTPIYSHLIYDIVPYKKKVLLQPDVLLLEGLNILKNNTHYRKYNFPFVISDFIDFSIYIDAPQDIIQTWYINRFLNLRKQAFFNPSSYFNHYTHLSEQDAIVTATKLWYEINVPNLEQNILPNHTNANLILSKSINHSVSKILLRQ